MADSSLLGRNDADTIALWAMVVFAIVAAMCSSPQTAEINARSRADTLMKWVRLGVAGSGVFVLVGVWVARKGRDKAWPIITGAGLAAAMLWWSYQHALQAGLASGQPGTEN